MKKLVLGLITIVIVNYANAFESGTYECHFGNEYFKVVLKNNGRAKLSGPSGTKRGYWIDDDDAAIVFNPDMVLEKRGNKFIFNLDNNPFTQLPCKKL